ncbi:ribosomal RNA small subunit methyltransferase A [Candidatus Altiarchaeales archaeon WOR_SM1_SCG]|nr:ribosomal RNA small subunit methyltransferase A [Candidatus Altiarchaeales archaeon WOR_SM1_SCG]
MPKQSQHFMTDKKILQRICNYANLNKDDTVLEIGAGTGNLTFEIAKFAAVYAIEKDEKLVAGLEKIKNKNIRIIRGDALKLTFPNFNKIVSNIPYGISRKITLKLLEYKFNLGILTVQKEFAEKLTASAGSKNYKFISSAAQSSWDIKILEYVSQQAFSPVPDVKSAIVEIKPSRDFDENYIEFIRNLFNHRNKKIKDTGKRIYELNPGELLELYNNQNKK